jgi:hypothetical protein
MLTLEEKINTVMRRRHPNFGSDFATPSSQRVDAHYVKLNLLDRWTWERFSRMCRFMQLTPYELGSIACIPHRVIEQWKLRSVLPMSATQGAYAVALILTVIESQVLAGHVSDVIEDPIPKL